MEKLRNLTDKQKEEIHKKSLIAQMPTAKDKLQTILTANGIAPNPYSFAEISFKDKVKDSPLICPFCLTYNALSSFYYDRGLYRCPKCNNNLKITTLEKMFGFFSLEGEIKVKEFALWVYEYRLNGFFQKMCLDVPDLLVQKDKDLRFKTWNKRLYDLGINYDFWDYYKRFKGEGEQKKREENEE